MPYVENNGVRIYYEVEGDGPPLVLAHGGSDSLEMWRRWGHSDALKDEFRLVLFDFRGYGKSDKPGDASAYGDNPANDVVAILDALDIPHAHYFGYSAGAATGYRLATLYPERFDSFILGGMTPFEWPEEMIKAVRFVKEGYELLRTDPDAYIERMESLFGRELSPGEREDFLDVDTDSGIAGMTSHIEGTVIPREDIAGIPVPCFIYCGELDPYYNGARESAELIPRAMFVSIPNADHISAFLRYDLIFPYIKQFIARVS
jgi:pimeloyl-ACP methyl ester carboxylesterase